MKKVSAQRKDNKLLQEATTAQLALEKRCNIIQNKPKKAESTLNIRELL